MRSPNFQESSSRRAALLSLASTVAVFASGLACGADITWSATTGNFAVTTNWTGGAIPGAADNAIINNSGTATINADRTVNGFFTGSSTGGGTFSQTAGAVVVNSAVSLGTGTGANGTYSLTGGTLQQGDGEFAVAKGSGSTGTFSVAGGTTFTRGTGDMVIGQRGTATMSLIGNLSSGGNFIVGDRSITGSSGAGSVVHTGGMFTSGGQIKIGQGNQQKGVNGAPGYYELSGGLIFANAGTSIGSAGATGTLNFVNGFISKATTGEFVVGEGSGGSGTMTQASGFLSCSSELWIGQGTGATGTYNFGGVAAVEAKNWLIVGNNGGTGTLSMTGGSFTKTPAGNPDSHAAFGSGNGSTATFNHSAGRFVNVQAETWLGASGNATATWNVSGSAEVVLALLELGHSDSAKGTLNLEGGTMSVTRIATASSGASTVNLNGGILKARESSGEFMAGLSAVTVKEGGANFDTDGKDIGIDQPLLDGGGGLSKSGDGKLTLTATCSYTGDTTVQKGTLAINGSLPASPVSVLENGTLAGKGSIGNSITVWGTISPGDDGGTLTVAGDVDIQSTIKPTASADVVSALVVTGNLNIEAATLDLTGVTLVPGTHTIATFGTLTGTEFAQVNGLPDGFSVGIAAHSITVTGAPSGYSAWASVHSLEGDDALADSDPDHDGLSNAVEFVVGGDPTTSGDGSKLPTGIVQGGSFVFKFRRTDESAYTEPVVQYGSNLSGWTTATDGTGGVTIVVTDNAFAGGDLVTVSIPLPVSGPIFARLKATIP